MTENRTAALSAAGVSIWLDDLSRERLTSGSLARLIAERNVVGVTTNPTIFAAALTDNDSYAQQVAELAAAGMDAERAVFEITTRDVQDACNLFLEVYRSSDGVDGRVSIEVSPTLAHDVEATVNEARRLWQKIDRPNLLIKIPATPAGLKAIAEVLAEGISVNVTLIFSLSQYRSVIDSYWSGIERARTAGLDIGSIHSVASFFVSRVDTEVDKRLDAFSPDSATSLRSQAALANAVMAYQLFESSLLEPRARSLIEAGANLQRPLWASTGVKDPALPDTLYVTELVAENTVNTMPEKTLSALADHGVVRGDTIRSQYDRAREVFTELDGIGIDMSEVTDKLMREGVDKFIVSWRELLETVSEALAR